ncbi:peroxisome membrane protein [Wallemia mellicola CBS 633.66]|uniref:Peroxisomal membrane protein PEX16 n=1 Tax=Wallemia mellicola (strain ATCC MYA-4683 / CBS 633.66) TaxID=671144 RepID=I4YIW7_WALMC|nr:peroxisome membrane protein [Wallemia mellicola CBS 633.66]EIM23909.1 peroxisome membrane protein [Wallemia mellicola CBS 633.66]|eukprot:XP_006955750.1 peroxisome membrane protein [Wallemia mellicola CBS 633.66]
MSKREKIAKMSLSVEPALRTLAWLLPGRFDDSELVAECIFSSLNVITQEQDIQNATHSKNPHSRYTTKADWGALHKISSRLLTLIGSLQLLGEIVMHRRERTSESAGKQRWNYISAVEALKFTLRLIILLKTRFRPLIHPSTPSRDQDSTLDPEYKPASKVRNVDEFKREYGTVDNYLRSVALGSDAFTPPSALVRPLNSIPQVVSELLLAAEPLVYALALRRQYIRTQTRYKPWRTRSEWTPLLISLSMSILSRQLRKYDQRNAVSPYAFDVNKSSIEMNEHMRREQSFIRYLLRGPIWSDFTKPRVESLVHRFENWPLIGLAAGIVGDYIPLVDNYHFYTSA